MTHDPLHTPLKPSGWRQRLRLHGSPAIIAFGIVLVALGVLFVWAWMTPPPPPATTAIERDLPPRPTSTTAGDASARGKAGASRPGAMPSAAPGTTASPPRDNTPVMRQGNTRILDVSGLPDESSAPSRKRTAERTARAQVEIAGALAPLPRAPRPGLVERTALGPLPRIAPDGRKPWLAYARPVSKELLRSSRPKLAILVVDLGLRAAITDEAIRALPAEVSLAFAPLGRNTRQLGHMARRHGHEFFLQLPLEPWGWPEVNPGPDTLLSSADSKANLQRLRRVMARAVGYAGLTTHAGQKFLQQGEALSPVLHELKRRGLLVVDDGAAAQSLLTALGLVVKLPTLRADVRVPAGLKMLQVRDYLRRARQLALQQGRALLVVPAERDSMRALRDWLANLTIDNDILLVPATALARLQQQQAP